MVATQPSEQEAKPVNLPTSFRDGLNESLDDYLENFSATPDAEAVANYVIEELEVWADDEGVDDIILKLEESGALESPFVEVFEEEMSSNDEFTFTGEEIISLLERMCGVEWVEDDDFDLGDDLDDDDLSEEI